MSVAEVARIAGVSVATVSRVLNNHPRVRPETAKQVRKVLDDLHYVRPFIRRGPRLGRRAAHPSGNIAVLVLGNPDGSYFRIPIYVATLSGVVRAAKESNLNVLVDHIPSLQQLAPAIRNRDVEGALVLTSWITESTLDALRTLRDQMPIVRMMGDAIGTSDIDHVGPDNLAVGQLAHQHLASRGCTELAFVTFQPQRELVRTRALGFATAAARHGHDVTAYLVSADASDAESYGRRAVRCDTAMDLAQKLAAAPRRPDGLFISRDAEAIQVQPLLQRLGIDLRSEMRIVSCDNDLVCLSMLDPRPVSIDLCPDEIGRRALIHLGGRIRRPDDHPVRVLVAPRIGTAPHAHPNEDALPD